jgi:hypothetical protein
MTDEPFRVGTIGSGFMGRLAMDVGKGDTRRSPSGSGASA